MVAHFLILIISCFCIYYADRYKDSFLGTINLMIVCGVLIIFGGLRDKSVGTDSGNYVRIYKSYKNLEFFKFPKTTIERGFVILQKIGHLISDKYVTIFMLVAIVNVAIYMLIIRKFSYHYLISVIVFITLGTYSTYFNAARQSLAISIFALSLYYVYHKKILSFLILVCIGFFFHQSIIILLPFYFLINIKYDLKKFIAILIGSSVLFVLAGKYLLAIDNSDFNRYTVYVNRGATGGYLLCLFYTVISAFFIYIREDMVKNKFPALKEFEFYLKLCLFSTIIYIIVVITGSDVNFIRMTVYFAPGYILIWPLIYLYLKTNKINTGLFVSVFIVMHTLFFYVMLDKMANLVPYKLNTEIF